MSLKFKKGQIFMKNVAIFGSSRSGKSTLAKMISKKHSNYHIIIGDDIRSVFQETLPGNNINSKGGIGMLEDFPNFMSHLFYKNIKRNKGEFNYIVETCDISPQKAYELFNQENTILLFLGTPQLSVKQHFNEIRKYETEKDWTYHRTDNHLLKSCEHWISKSKEFEKQCKELKIWYVDTSFNRENILNNTLQRIENLL